MTTLRQKDKKRGLMSKLVTMRNDFDTLNAKFFE